jgi:hypothetical protein
MLGAPSSFFGVPAGEVAPRGRCLVVPLLSVGNVPQLAVDLVVNSFALARCGIVTDDAVEPMASSHVYSHRDGAAFACELFQFHDTVLLQLRSKLRQNEIGPFCQRLAAFAGSFAEVVVLGSADAGWLMHPDVDRLNVKYTAAKPEAAATLEALGLKALRWETSKAEETMHDAVFPKRSFAGLLQEAVKHAATELVLFCNEGENIPESQLLARVLIGYLQKRGYVPPETTLVPKPPPSWHTMLVDENADVVRQLFQ